METEGQRERGHGERGHGERGRGTWREGRGAWREGERGHGIDQWKGVCWLLTFYAIVRLIYTCVCHKSVFAEWINMIKVTTSVQDDLIFVLKSSTNG